MTRAEEEALKAYPECMVYNDLAMEYEDVNGCYRCGFEVGYEQAEKDLALTWQDIAHLNAMVGMLTEQGFKGNVFEEVLRRFLESKK